MPECCQRQLGWGLMDHRAHGRVLATARLCFGLIHHEMDASVRADPIRLHEGASNEKTSGPLLEGEPLPYRRAMPVPVIRIRRAGRHGHGRRQPQLLMPECTEVRLHANRCSGIAMTHTRPKHWLIRGQRLPYGRARVYCFGHAGASANEFVRWAALTSELEIIGVQLPGRGTRLREAPVSDLKRLVRIIVDEVSFEPPFGFFGHSLGGLLAFELSRELRRVGKPMPTWLWVSAYPAPNLQRSESPIRDLDNADFLRAVQERHGGIPLDVHENPELAGLVVPPLKADQTMVETYVHEWARPLPCALTVFGGSADSIPEESLQRWQGHTTGRFALEMFEGGHFYLREHAPALVDRLVQEVSLSSRVTAGF